VVMMTFLRGQGLPSYSNASSDLAKSISPPSIYEHLHLLTGPERRLLLVL
jgi:hypothetical protein